MDFQATANGIAKTITIPDNGQSREELAPVAAKAFQAYLDSNPAAAGSPAPAAPTAPPDNSYANDLGSGVHALETGVRSTSRLIGNELPDGTWGKQALQNFGAAAPVTSEPAGGYQSAGGRLADDLRGGNYSQALSDLPHAAVQAAPAMAGALGAGAVGTALAPEALGGAALGSAAGITGFTAATNAGDNVAARAANNGRTLDTASGGDIAGGLATTGLQAAGNVVGLRPGMLPVVGKSIAAAGPLVRGAADVGADAVAGGLNSVVGQTGDTIGTDRGLSVDPYTAAAAAATAGASRAGSVIGRIGTSTAQDALSNLGGPGAPSSVSEAQRDIAVHQAVLQRQTQDSASLRRPVTYDEAANTLRLEQRSNLDMTGRTLASQMDPEDAAQFRTDYTTLLDQAATHNKSVGPSDDGSPSSAFDRVQNWNIPDDYKTNIQDGMLSLDALSQAARKNRATGPFQRIGGLAGQALAIGGGFMAGPATGVAALMGHNLEGAIGSKVGAGLDSLLGTSNAPSVLKANAAQKYLTKQGVAPDGSNPLQASNDLLNTVQDPQNSIASQLPPAPPGPNAPILRADGSMLTPSQYNTASNYSEGAGRWMEQQLIQKARAQAAAQAAAASSLQTDGAASALNGLRDQQTLDGLSTKSAALVEAQKVAAEKANATKQAQEDAAWASRDPTYKQQQATQEKGRTLNERAANALQGGLYRTDPNTQDARAAGVIGAPALAANNPQALFQATGGMHGSPALPSDPLMVSGSGQRMALSPAAQAAQARAQAANAAPAIPAPESAPSGPNVLPGGLQSYIVRAANSRGVHPTGHDVNAAVDDLVQTDNLDPRIGDLIKSGANIPVNSPEAKAVLAQTFHRIGLGAHVMNGAQLVDPNAPMAAPAERPAGLPPARAPINDITRWMAAREDAKQHVVQVARTAIAQGLPQAVPVIQAIGAAPAAADKEKLRADFLATLPQNKQGMEAYKAAQALLNSPLLMKGI